MRATLRDLYITFSLLFRDLKLPFALLAVEPDATPGEHRGDHEELEPILECYAEAVADEDSADHEDNGRTSPQKLPSGRPPARRLLIIHARFSSLLRVVCRVESPRASLRLSTWPHIYPAPQH